MQSNNERPAPLPRLLLVEDQLDLADLMEQALTDEGNEIAHANSVFEALGMLDSGHFDGAVLDVELRDGVVFPVADRLLELGIPYLFASAVYDQLVPVRHRRAPFWPNRSMCRACSARCAKRSAGRPPRRRRRTSLHAPTA